MLYVRTKAKNIPRNKFVLTDLTIEVKYWLETSEIDSSSHKDKSFHHFETLGFFIERGRKIVTVLMVLR